MSGIFKNPVSGLVTKGLGMSACCGMLTVGFGLFTCRVEVIGSGGGSFAVYPGVYRKWSPKASRIKNITDAKTVRIVVKHKSHMWDRSFVVGPRSANIVVGVVNLINRLKQVPGVVVQSIRKGAATIRTIFNKDK